MMMMMLKLGVLAYHIENNDSQLMGVTRREYLRVLEHIVRDADTSQVRDADNGQVKTKRQQCCSILYYCGIRLECCCYCCVIAS